MKRLGGGGLTPAGRCRAHILGIDWSIERKGGRRRGGVRGEVDMILEVLGCSTEKIRAGGCFGPKRPISSAHPQYCLGHKRKGLGHRGSAWGEVVVVAEVLGYQGEKIGLGGRQVGILAPKADTERTCLILVGHGKLLVGRVVETHRVRGIGLLKRWAVANARAGNLIPKNRILSVRAQYQLGVETSYGVRGVMGMWSLNGYVVGSARTNWAGVLTCKTQNQALCARFRFGSHKLMRKGCRGGAGYTFVNKVMAALNSAGGDKPLGLQNPKPSRGAGSVSV